MTDHVSGRSRSAVAAVRAAAAAGYRPVVTVSQGRVAAAAVSRYCAATLDVPDADLPGYREAIDDELAGGRYAAVLPASDVTVMALDLPGAALVDKAALPALAGAAGLRVPETIDVADPRDLGKLAGDLRYPVVVKPARKSPSPDPTCRVDTPAALTALAARLQGPVVVQPFGSGTIRAVCGVIHGGELRAVVHQSYVRIFPVDCGVASAAVTVDPDLELESRLPPLLGRHDGVFQVQLVDDQLIDVNPRVYGSLPLAVAAGANLPAVAAAAAQGRDADLVRGRAGVRYRWIEGDLRAILSGLRAGRYSELRALRPRRGTVHSIESLRDPGPGLTRLAEVARNVIRW